MKHKLTVVFLLLCTLLMLFGCGRTGPAVSAALDRAENLINEYPDSAYRMLRDLNGKAKGLST